MVEERLGGRPALFSLTVAFRLNISTGLQASASLQAPSFRQRSGPARYAARSETTLSPASHGEPCPGFRRDPTKSRSRLNLGGCLTRRHSTSDRARRLHGRGLQVPTRPPINFSGRSPAQRGVATIGFTPFTLDAKVDIGSFSAGSQSTRRGSISYLNGKVRVALAARLTCSAHASESEPVSPAGHNTTIDFTGRVDAQSRHVLSVKNVVVTAHVETRPQIRRSFRLRGCRSSRPRRAAARAEIGTALTRQSRRQPVIKVGGGWASTSQGRSIRLLDYEAAGCRWPRSLRALVYKLADASLSCVRPVNLTAFARRRLQGEHHRPGLRRRRRRRDDQRPERRHPADRRLPAQHRMSAEPRRLQVERLRSSSAARRSALGSAATKSASRTGDANSVSIAALQRQRRPSRPQAQAT